MDLIKTIEDEIIYKGFMYIKGGKTKQGDIHHLWMASREDPIDPSEILTFIQAILILSDDSMHWQPLPAAGILKTHVWINIYNKTMLFYFKDTVSLIIFLSEERMNKTIKNTTKTAKDMKDLLIKMEDQFSRCLMVLPEEEEDIDDDTTESVEEW